MGDDVTMRCEPGEEDRGRDGWHWLGNDCPVFWIAEDQEWDWAEDERVRPDDAYRYGYRYISPVATPAEVEAIREERDEARAGEDAANDAVAACVGQLRERDAELSILRARVETQHDTLTQAEACMSIVMPRSDMAEYRRILGVIRAALSPQPKEDGA